MSRYKLNAIVVVLIVGALILASQSQYSYGSRNFLNDLGNSFNDAGNGASAGQQQARNDYRNTGEFDNDCPNPPGDWCNGYIGGYQLAWNAMELSGEPPGGGSGDSGDNSGNDDNGNNNDNDNGNNDNDNNGNSGTSEDDGEFVPRKRVIGQD
jgi:hypothetical protein